jgi:uncharacterized iron-regulated protein
VLFEVQETQKLKQAVQVLMIPPVTAVSTQKKADYTVQFEAQPSLLLRLPSSQASPVILNPSPHLI